MTHSAKRKIFSNRSFKMILLLILVIGWNAFSTYSFLAHKKQHKERLQGLVLQAKQAHQSISQGRGYA
jgi:hypothetical protein